MISNNNLDKDLNLKKKKEILTTLLTFTRLISMWLSSCSRTANSEKNVALCSLISWEALKMNYSKYVLGNMGIYNEVS